MFPIVYGISKMIKSLSLSSLILVTAVLTAGPAIAKSVQIEAQAADASQMDASVQQAIELIKNGVASSPAGQKELPANKGNMHRDNDKVLIMGGSEVVPM